MAASLHSASVVALPPEVLHRLALQAIQILGPRKSDSKTYALYPHMTVAENMGFGLKMTGHPKAKTDAKVAGAARILKLEPLFGRKPKALSGGQRQRVAIGRAIVRGPEVFLFDEPLSNLDAELRVEMRVEIARLHREIAATKIYVTHDQVFIFIPPDENCDSCEFAIKR